MTSPLTANVNLKLSIIEHLYLKWCRNHSLFPTSWPPESIDLSSMSPIMNWLYPSCTSRLKPYTVAQLSLIIRSLNLPADITSKFRTSLMFSVSLKVAHQIILVCFQSTINNACTTLSESLPSHDTDWVTDELRNLSKKKSNAWLWYSNAFKQGNKVSQHRKRYKHYCK